MIRKATCADLFQIEESYNEHFSHELEHGAYTIFKKGIYPTREVAEKALNANALHVCERNGVIAGSIIADNIQPPEYQGVAWQLSVPPPSVLVIHLLLVRPALAGQGVGSGLVNHVIDQAKNCGCKAVRLDTGSQNIPAVTLYGRLGFKITGGGTMKVGNTISHEGHLFLEKII